MTTPQFRFAGSVTACAGSRDVAPGLNGCGWLACQVRMVRARLTSAGLSAWFPSGAGKIDIDGTDISRLPIHQRARLGLSGCGRKKLRYFPNFRSKTMCAVLGLQTDEAGKTLNKAGIDKRLNTLLSGVTNRWSTVKPCACTFRW